MTNSLTRSKQPLLTHTEGVVTWYQCGPTVYDSAHIGHACTYVWFDIIRRLLTNHFGLVVLQAQVSDQDPASGSACSECCGVCESLMSHPCVSFVDATCYTRAGLFCI